MRISDTDRLHVALSSGAGETVRDRSCRIVRGTPCRRHEVDGLPFGPGVLHVGTLVEARVVEDCVEHGE